MSAPRPLTDAQAREILILAARDIWREMRVADLSGIAAVTVTLDMSDGRQIATTYPNGKESGTT